MENITPQNQGLLKILQDLYILLKNGKQASKNSICMKVGCEEKYWNKMISVGIIKNKGFLSNKPIYIWNTIPPNMHMAQELLKDFSELLYMNSPDSDLFDQENNYAINIHDKSENRKAINTPFEEFWNLYDKKVGPKDKCEKLWNKLKDSERSKIMETLPLFLNSIKDKQFIPYPQSYLNQKRWNDEIKVEYIEQKTTINKNYEAINKIFPLSNYSIKELFIEIARRNDNNFLKPVLTKDLWNELKDRGAYIENNKLYIKNSLD